MYRSASDAVFQALNLPGFDGLKIRTRLEEALGVDVWVDNDVNLAALREAHSAEEYGDCPDFAAISLGTGIGMGLVLDEAATAVAIAVSHLCFIADPQKVIFSGEDGVNREFVQAR